MKGLICLMLYQSSLNLCLGDFLSSSLLSHSSLSNLLLIASGVFVLFLILLYSYVWLSGPSLRHAEPLVMASNFLATD